VRSLYEQLFDLERDTPTRAKNFKWI